MKRNGWLMVEGGASVLLCNWKSIYQNKNQCALKYNIDNNDTDGYTRVFLNYNKEDFTNC